MTDEAPILAIAREVEAYLTSHPAAADTAQGILRWWLPRVRVEESAAALQRALDVLVERGVVVRREVHGGGIVYSKALDCPTPPRSPSSQD
jgi:Fe2+ or Zn2+ uptake regulation protein